jgi:hypothetical protein
MEDIGTLFIFASKEEAKKVYGGEESSIAYPT